MRPLEELACETDGWQAELERRLALLDAGSLRRRLRAVDRPVEPIVVREGRELVNLSSNNYLGLAGHPAIEEAIAIGARRGAGSTASRLVVGTDEAVLALEAAIASHKGTQAALLYGSGYLANVGVLSAVLRRDDYVFADRLNHASSWDGIRLSGATLHRYRHCDADHLASLLESTRPRRGRALIVTETVFSMDGDVAPLAELVELKEHHGALLVVDEAHAGGVFGPHGEGYAHELGVVDRVDLHVGTFGKAYGVCGAYVAASRGWIDLLVSTSRPFVYTTALPPAVVDGITTALRIVREAGERRQMLATHSKRFRRRLEALGLDTCGSTTQIVPVVAGESERALALAAALEERGVLAVGIRPPTVPEGSARVRFSLTAAHGEGHLELALNAIEEAWRALA